MKLKATRICAALAFSLVTSFSGGTLEPQTLFNFEVSPRRVPGTLVEAPDANFYGTTAHGGPLGNETVFRVTPAGVLTTIVSDAVCLSPQTL